MSQLFYDQVRKLPMKGYPLIVTDDISGSLGAANESFAAHLKWLSENSERRRQNIPDELQRVKAGMQPIHAELRRAQAEVQRLQALLKPMADAEAKLNSELNGLSPVNMELDLLRRAEVSLNPALRGFTDLKMANNKHRAWSDPVFVWWWYQIVAEATEIIRRESGQVRGGAKKAPSRKKAPAKNKPSPARKKAAPRK